jgi:hypothetical protein
LVGLLATGSASWLFAPAIPDMAIHDSGVCGAMDMDMGCFALSEIPSTS